MFNKFFMLVKYTYILLLRLPCTILFGINCNIKYEITNHSSKLGDVVCSCFGCTCVQCCGLEDKPRHQRHIHPKQGAHWCHPFWDQITQHHQMTAITNHQRASNNYMILTSFISVFNWYNKCSQSVSIFTKHFCVILYFNEYFNHPQNEYLKVDF